MVAIALALISKEVYSSLFLGCIVAALLLANFSPWQMVVNFIGAGENVGMINAIDISILIFLVILGIMVDLMNKAGGSAAFGRWARKAVKTRCGAQLMTMLLGVLIFIDDYFNCLTVGAVMRPVTESHKISRAKLAYIIDATAAPVCMLAPVSSWAAAVSSYVPDGFPGSRISMFLSQIPYNYYCILTLIMVIVVSVFNIDGIMVPLVCAVFNWDTQIQLLSIGLAASCAGGVCGDHLSPISDTTIMASAGAHCYHLNHVATQIPYGVTVAAVSFVSFILAGLIQNAVICMIIAIVLMIVTLLVIKAIVSKKHAGIFEEMAAADKVLYNK